MKHKTSLQTGLQPIIIDLDKECPDLIDYGIGAAETG